MMKQRRNKYNARKTIMHGITFHSAAEANRYKVLKLLEKSGHIKDLKLQVPINFYSLGEKMFTYYADFTYYDSFNKLIIEDVKGVKTAIYKLKKKLIENFYNIKITEVK